MRRLCGLLQIFLCFNVVTANIISKYSVNYTINECIINCMSDMIKYLNNANTLIISNTSGIISHSLYPRIILSNNSFLTTEINRIDLYVAVFQTTTEFGSWLEDIQLYKFWKPSSKFIISILQPGNTTEIFELAWKNYVINVNVILIINNECEVYTYYPYQSESCIVNTTGKLLFRYLENKPRDIFPEKVPKQFNGCPFKILACIVTPFVISYTGNKENTRDVGFEVTLFNSIFKKLNFTQIYIPHNMSCWGTRLPNGTYTLLYGALQRKEADIVIGAATLEANSTDFDTLSRGTVDSIYWWVPTPDLQSPWANIHRVFSPYVWCLMIVSIIVNAFIWWIFGRNTENYVFNDIVSCIAASLLIFLQGGTRSPETGPLRILFACWLIVIVITYTAYQSQLVSALTKPKYEKQITTVEEMLEKLSFGFTVVGLYHYDHPTDPIDIKVRASYFLCPMNMYCMNRTAYQKDFSVLRGSFVVKYSASKLFTYSDGRPMIYGIKSGVLVNSRFVLNKGDPRLKRLNFVLNLLFNNGLAAKWLDDITAVKKFVVEPENIILSIKHLALGFLILFIGYIISIIVFIIEILHFKYSN